MNEPLDYAQDEIISETEKDHIHHTAVGTIQGFIASALSLPTGLITAGFLTRKLGPEGYGLLTVTASIIGFIEIIITLGFSRTAVKFVAEAKNWRSVTPGLVRAQLLVSIGATLMLMVAAPILAMWLGSSELSRYLRLYALDIPIFALEAIYISILIGQGHFGRRAFLIAGFWLSRLVLIILFVSAGFSIAGAILANVGDSVLITIAARIFVGPSLLGRSTLPFRRLWNYALPLFLFSVGQSLLWRLDLLFVRALTSIPQATGFYGVAQNLSFGVGLLTNSFSPLLLGKLTQLSQLGKGELACAMCKQSMRLIFCLLPFAAMAAGAAPEVVIAIYGRSFISAGPLLTLLVFAPLAFSIISLTASMLIAADRPSFPIALLGPLVLLAIGVHLFCVPRFGAIGAAATTTVLAWLGAGASILVVCRIWQILPPTGTLGRSIVVSGFAYAVASFWPTPGFWLLLKLPVIGLINVLALLSLGEFSADEIALARSMVRW